MPQGVFRQEYLAQLISDISCQENISDVEYFLLRIFMTGYISEGKYLSGLISEIFPGVNK